MVKNISLSDEAYEQLKQRKLPGESFSKVVIKITKQKGNIWDHFGAWKDMPEEDFRQIEETIKKGKERRIKQQQERMKEWSA